MPAVAEVWATAVCRRSWPRRCETMPIVFNKTKLKPPRPPLPLQAQQREGEEEEEGRTEGRRQHRLALQG